MRTAAEGYAISTDRTWWFLDTLVIEHQVAGDRNVFVFEQLLPEGASPPLHVHDVLDDSFFALEGKIVFRRGDEVFLAEPGRWVLGAERNTAHISGCPRIGPHPARARRLELSRPALRPR